MKKFEMAEIEVAKFEISDILTVSSDEVSETTMPPVGENGLGWG